MKLSIIIVNYNVKYFLEQCLSSVQKAITSIEAEVLVVDNASSDGSIEFLRARFPFVKFLVNDRNAGFARANNDALYKCKGEFVLYLNPDTIIAEDCLEKCIEFLGTTPAAGALGIRMVDGQGLFLPESKRSFPSPVISFFKLVGLTNLFPSSRFFARYNLGYLDQYKNHEVDVLAGAFLLARRDLLLKLEGFDETFFMYGEDVDLSYRIQQLGYKNYYFSGSSIIHFKGESTKKGSLNYVRMFYQAMSIFVKKHYRGGKASIFSFFIVLAIWLRAGLSAISSAILKIGFPVVDFLVVFSSFKIVNLLWVSKVRGGDTFNNDVITYIFPAFSLVFLLSAVAAGLYDHIAKLSKAFYAGLIASLVVLAAYSLLPEKLRFSRGVILFSGIIATVLITCFRWLLVKLELVENKEQENKKRQTLVVGTKEEFATTKQLLIQSGLQKRLMGRISTTNNKEDALFTLEELPSVLESLQAQEIIFCEGYLSYKTIIEKIQHLPRHVNARFHSHNTLSIVGSDSKDTSGEFVAIDGSFELSQPVQLRRKRLVDMAVALGILVTFPVHIILGGGRIVYNALLVMTGFKTWVGYSQNTNKLPRLRKGVLTTNGRPVKYLSQNNNDSQVKIDEWYARNYHWLQDVKLVARHYKKLGANTR